MLLLLLNYKIGLNDMSKLKEFKSMIDDISDIETLESAYSVLSDVLSIIEMQEKIKAKESSLTDGGKAMFYFFAMGLSSEEVPTITEKINGRIRRLSKEKERVAAADAAEQEKEEKEEEQEEEQE